MSNLYARIDVAMTRDPRMIAAGPLARLLYIHCVLYSRENLTDGRIDRAVLALVSVDIRAPKRYMDKLVEIGSLIAVEGGWQIPLERWTKYNPLRAEVEETRAQKAEAGIVGNHKRWHTATNPSRTCDLCCHAGWIAHASQSATVFDRTARNGRDPHSHSHSHSQRESSSTNGYKTPVENPTDDDERIEAVIQHIATNRTQRRRPAPTNPERFKLRTATNLRTENLPAIAALAEAYPAAPYDVIAAAFDGDTHSLRHYTTTEDS